MPGTVTVACKLPHGLILRVFDRKDVPEPQQGGGTKDVEKWLPRPNSVQIKGYAEKYDPSLPPAARTSSYALTHGVDKEFFEQWLKQNHDHDAVVRGLIFAQDKPESARAKALEMKATRSGLEPIDPAKLPKRIQSFNREDQAA